MKDYISARCLAMVVAVALIAALLACAKWRVLSSEAISGLLGVIAASLRDLLRTGAQADGAPPPSSTTLTSTTTSPLTIAGAGLVAASIAGLLGGGCGLSQSDVATAGQDTATLCEAVARMRGRDDVAAYCHAAGGVLGVVDQLLVETETCAVPARDGGAMEDRK